MNMRKKKNEKFKESFQVFPENDSELDQVNSDFNRSLILSKLTSMRKVSVLALAKILGVNYERMTRLLSVLKLFPILREIQKARKDDR
jgi:hypothetical protein